MAGVAENALWLMPSKEEQLARLQRRHPDGVNEGYVWGWNLIHSQLEGTTATVIVVDGQTIDQTLTAVEQTFSPILESSPTPPTTKDRQSLIRLSNHQLAKQLTESPRPPRNDDQTFDCECAHPTCTKFVNLPLNQIPPALTHPPPSITAPEHSTPT